MYHVFDINFIRLADIINFRRNIALKFYFQL